MLHLRSHRPQPVHYPLRRRDGYENGALRSEGEGGVGAGEAGIPAGGANEVRVRGAEGGDGALGEVADAAGGRGGRVMREDD